MSTLERLHLRSNSMIFLLGFCLKRKSFSSTCWFSDYLVISSCTWTFFMNSSFSGASQNQYGSISASVFFFFFYFQTLLCFYKQSSSSIFSFLVKIIYFFLSFIPREPFLRWNMFLSSRKEWEVYFVFLFLWPCLKEGFMTCGKVTVDMSRRNREEGIRAERVLRK